MKSTYNMHEAKSQLSRLAARVAKGEEITIARSGTPVAKLVPIAEKPKKLKFGQWKGEIWISDDFDAPLPKEIQDAFEGKGDWPY
ncbi:MAG: type II toxin-antitoxin system Phd/YefM family antitoxin [Actinomycetota bacterium]|nr:type II toxin-antitoxin system Phd/YefM family antitoxin [Actinomycetota bacterium]